MYLNAATHDAYDRFWAAWANNMRERGIDAPMHLTKSDDVEAAWSDPDLLVSQTCGYPYASKLRGQVRLIATPHYGVEGCDGPNYSSWIVMRTDDAASGLEDLRGKRVAFNAMSSQSGYNSLRAVIAPLADKKKFFSETRQSGGHARSMHMVASGEADCAAVDAVSWALTVAAEPELGKRLKRMAVTSSLPGLPFITVGNRSDADMVAIRNALLDTLADPALSGTMMTLKLCGASVIPDKAYDACLDMEREATKAGYPHLA